jgi:hypothetical protein
MPWVKLLHHRLIAGDFDRQVAGFLVPGSWFLVLGSWFLVRDAVLNGFMELGITVTEAVGRLRPRLGINVNRPIF